MATTFKLRPAITPDAPTIWSVAKNTMIGWPQGPCPDWRFFWAYLPAGHLQILEIHSPAGITTPGFVLYANVRPQVHEVTLAIWPEQPRILRPVLWDLILQEARNIHSHRLEFFVPAYKDGLVRFLKTMAEHEGTQRSAAEHGGRWIDIDMFAVILE